MASTLLPGAPCFSAEFFVTEACGAGGGSVEDLVSVALFMPAPHVLHMNPRGVDVVPPKGCASGVLHAAFDGMATATAGTPRGAFSGSVGTATAEVKCPTVLACEPY